MERLWEAALDATGATGEQLLLALSVVFITLLFVVLKAAVSRPRPPPPLPPPPPLACPRPKRGGGTVAS